MLCCPNATNQPPDGLTGLGLGLQNLVSVLPAIDEWVVRTLGDGVGCGRGADAHRAGSESRPRLVERKARGAKPEGYLSPEAQKSLLMPSVPNERQAMSDQERNALAERLGNYVRRRS